MFRIEIPMKLPSLNEYVRANRTIHGSYFAGAGMKREIEQEIIYHTARLPRITKPVWISFTWVEANRKRDKDNIAFGKKFVLDALQKAGKLPNDNWKWVRGFSDRFEIGPEYKVILEIEEETNGRKANVRENDN